MLMSLLSSVIQKSAYCLYVAKDACCQLAHTPKGMFIIKQFIVSCIGATHTLARRHNKTYVVLDITVKQLKIVDPFVTKIATTLNAWQSSIHTLRYSGLSKKWRLLKCICQTTAKSLNFARYFDNLGAHSVDGLIKWDEAVCKGIGAHVGASSLFQCCGMSTMKGFINRLSILASVCAIIDATQSYIHYTIPSTQLSTTALSSLETLKRIYAIPIAVMQIGKESLKITLRVMHENSLLKPYIATGLLALTIYQELFKIYYVGTEYQPPRTIHPPKHN